MVLSPPDADLLREHPQLAAYVDGLRAERDTFEQAFDHAPIGMALVGLDGRILRVNAALCEMLERTEPDLLVRRWDDLVHADDAAGDRELKRLVLDGLLPSYATETRCLTQSGRVLWSALAVSLVRDADGGARHFVSQIQDISERKRVEADLRHAADHDALTGLINRRRFGRDLDRQVERSRRYGEPAAVVVLDLDHLKDVNDTLGHQAGDELLVRVAGALSARLRSTDVLARLGGDEFAALLNRVTPDEALMVADALVRSVGDLEAGICTASAGVAAFAGGSPSASELLGVADRAMYAAKSAGRDRAVLDATIV